MNIQKSRPRQQLVKVVANSSGRLAAVFQKTLVSHNKKTSRYTRGFRPLNGPDIFTELTS
jgi:hypothetical protein